MTESSDIISVKTCRLCCQEVDDSTAVAITSDFFSKFKEVTNYEVVN